MRKRFHELHGIAAVEARGRKGSVGRHAVNMALVSSGVLIEVNCPETGALLPVTYRVDSARASAFRNTSRATADKTRRATRPRPYSARCQQACSARVGLQHRLAAGLRRLSPTNVSTRQNRTCSP